jgi:hypothetical protein
MADSDEPQVTRDDLRAALASGSDQPRRRPVLLDWTSDLTDADRDELDQLRSTVRALNRRIDELKLAAARELELRAALGELAGAGLFHRRSVLQTLRRRGLVS